MDIDKLYEKALSPDPVSTDEGVALYNLAPLPDLMFIADRLRKVHKHGANVGWIIDRNINITNICYSRCYFCNFCRKKGDKDAFVTTREQYHEKIEGLFAAGGNQVLLQGGMNPDLGLDFYTDLFTYLKKLYPTLRLHALGPPEIVFLAAREKISYLDVLSRLVDAGLDSLPGAGAEILSERVRKIVSPAKCSAEEWIEVMRTAHGINLPTSATMMFGHAETVRERIEHLVKLRELQAGKKEDHHGFITFIPWPFMDEATRLKESMGINSTFNRPDYIRIIALSRIMLNNIRNIQASILTVGKETAMMSLHAGANDLGSVMMEENVVSSAGSKYSFSANDLQAIIMEAGFSPVRRNQKYEPV
jgi:cyclic dehypoxanthinyl futalosine synthase